MNIPPKAFAAGQLIVGDNAFVDYCQKSEAHKTAFVISDNVAANQALTTQLFTDIYGSRDHKIIATVSTEPTKAQLESYMASIRDYKPDTIIAVGGGSVIDTAKTLWLFLELPHLTWESAMKYYQVEKRPGNTILVAVPTTSGTGSEMTGAAMLTDENGVKKMILTNEVLPSIAILDFTFLKSLPPKVIVYSGVDALTHALEAATDTISDPFTQFLCIQAIVTLFNDLPKSLKGDLEARNRVHIASMVAGFGINHGGCGLAHSLNTPGEDYHLPHGLITGMMLPYTIDALVPSPIIASILSQLGKPVHEEKDQVVFKDLLWELYDQLNMPKCLKDLGLDESEYLVKIDKYCSRFETNDRAYSVAASVPSPDQIRNIFTSLYYGPKGR
jgi:acetaldehyde dehydrogenase/alcohol dehydrogenase